MTISGQPGEPPDPRYVEARRVLLDALTALAPHGKALIVAGAQAVYLRTGLSDLGIAPYTTDGDLALDPTLLGDEPELEESMLDAGFKLLPVADHVEPGIWVKTAKIAGEEVIIPVDLIVPEGVATGGGTRGARLGPHGKRAARRAVGLEAALVDHDTMTVKSLDPTDTRAIDVEVAGMAALLVAKAHKIHDRLATDRPDRLKDKDAADIFRIMQTSSAKQVGATLSELRTHATAGAPTTAAIDFLSELFDRRAGDGVQMATRALRLAVPEDQIIVLCTTYTRALTAATAN